MASNQPDIPYEELLDWMEDKNKLLKLKLKRSEAEAEEWRQIANALAHAFAVTTDEKKKQPLWVHEYYRKWENKQKEWFGV